MSAFTLENNQAIATLTFDMPDSSVNLLTKEVLEELDTLLEAIKKRDDIKILLIKSAKKDIFIAGADIAEIASLYDEKEAYEIVRRGQIILRKIAFLECITVAIIDGACLGGGFELALNCDYRIATHNPKTKIGLPEVNLGVLPGFGGTQLLKRLIGTQKALELILGAKQINGAKAEKLKMVDASVPQGYLDFKIESFTQALLDANERAKIDAKRYKESMLERYGADIIFYLAHKEVLKKTKGHYEAPLKVIELFKATQTLPINEALSLEASAFAHLAITPTCKNLISLFFAQEQLKATQKTNSDATDISSCGVIGSGTMGGGIVWLLSKIDRLTRIKARSYSSITSAFSAIDEAYRALLKRRRLTQREVDAKVDKISYTTNYSGFNHIDLVIEAIIEDVEAKKATYKELEAVLKEDAIIATNTSSLSITMLASELEHPERFIGMHFFNPVPRMPLVEVIPSPTTSQKVVDKVIALARESGKTPIVVGDCAGFLVNRILLTYVNEAVRMFEEGGDIAKIDKVIEDFGMPMGPFRLSDEVGLDVGYKVSKVLFESYGERMALSPLLERIYNSGELGKKSSKGFYTYPSKEKNPTISAMQIAKCDFDSQEIIDRAMLIMVNEAAMALEEEIVEDASTLDLAMVMGTGFAPFRGGLLRYADSIGIERLHVKLLQLQERYGDRFKPAKRIVKMREESETFYKG